MENNDFLLQEDRQDEVSKWGYAKVSHLSRGTKADIKVRGGIDNKRAADQVDLVVEDEFQGRLFFF